MRNSMNVWFESYRQFLGMNIAGLPSQYWLGRKCLPKHPSWRLETCSEHKHHHIWVVSPFHGIEISISYKHNIVAGLCSSLTRCACRNQTMRIHWIMTLLVCWETTQKCLNLMLGERCLVAMSDKLSSLAAYSMWRFGRLYIWTPI